VIRVDSSKREKLVSHLNAHGVESRVYYPIPLHVQECYRSLGYKPQDLPQSMEAADTTLALPVYPELTGDEIAFIAENIKNFLKK